MAFRQYLQAAIAMNLRAAVFHSPPLERQLLLRGKRAVYCCFKNVTEIQPALGLLYDVENSKALPTASNTRKPQVSVMKKLNINLP